MEPGRRAGDFPARDPAERLEYMAASRVAHDEGTQAPDIAAEQANILWADMIILQFPFWWFSMPAIMKGWVDRVFANGFAYGQTDPARPGRSCRYGNGPLEGKRSMIVLTAANREPGMGPRGVSGHIDDLLHPIHHGILWYTGMSVLPPFVVYDTGNVPSERYAALTQALEARLLALETTAPIPYRTQNGGDYDDDLVLKPGLEGEARGLKIHLRRRH